MKKKLAVLLIAVMSIMMLASCGGEEITLDLSFGERTGTYEGDMKDGIPHGNGKFSSENEDGDKWTYEGEFKNGHFEGKGTTTWDDGRKQTGTYVNDEIVPITGKDLKKVYSNPDQYKNNVVEVTGQVFGGVDYEDGVIALQMWADPENNERNTVVYIYDEDFEVEDEDYIKVKGIVAGTFKGENMMGGEVTGLEIDAIDQEVVSYAEACSPANSIVEVNKTVTQYGYAVTVDKVEFADKETRMFVTVTNNGSSEFSLFTFDSKIIQNGSQYESQDNWQADYPDISGDIAVGVSKSGIVAFPAIEEGNFKAVFDAYSDNWEEDIEDFVFDIAI